MHDAMVEPLLVPDGEVLRVFHDGEGEADEARRNQQLLICPATETADLKLQLHSHECALLTLQSVLTSHSSIRNLYALFQKLIGTCKLRNKDPIGTFSNQNRDPNQLFIKFNA